MKNISIFYSTDVSLNVSRNQNEKYLDRYVFELHWNKQLLDLAKILDME